jgi:hypothetical protein
MDAFLVDTSNLSISIRLLLLPILFLLVTPTLVAIHAIPHPLDPLDSSFCAFLQPCHSGHSGHSAAIAAAKVKIDVKGEPWLLLDS